MKYKKKLTILFSITAGLAIAFICSLIFSPERMNTRSSLYTWLDPKLAESAEKIVLWNKSETINLIRKNNAWYVKKDETEYPAKQLRIADLIAALTRHAAFPVRTGSESAFERLGVDESAASKITVAGPYGQVLLELLIGNGDALGQNIYLRKSGTSEVRSGEDKISAYLFGGLKSWFNLKLIPENEDNQMDIDKVQRMSVFSSEAETGGSTGSLVFSRKGRQWTFNNIDDAELDMEKVDAYVRAVLYAEGDEFSTEVLPNDPVLKDSRIMIEFGNGSVKTIYLSAAQDDRRRYATVSGSDLVYSLAEWMAARLFNTADYFKKEQ